MFSPLLHLVLHGIIPGIAAFLAFRKIWLKALLILGGAMIIDLDHLLASPVYVPDRCSINFHPLHSYPAIGTYILLLFVPKLRIFGVGLMLHIAIDLADCMM